MRTPGTEERTTEPPGPSGTGVYRSAILLRDAFAGTYTQAMRKPEPLAGWIAFGVVLSALGGGMIVLGLAADLLPLSVGGVALAIFGGTLVQIAVVAIGVQWGIERADYGRWSRESARV